LHGGKNKFGISHPENAEHWHEWRAQRAALGLPLSAGRSYPGPRNKRKRLIWLIDKAVEAIPKGPVDKPVEQWSHGEVLSDGARHGLLRLRQFAMRDPDNLQGWEQRLILQAAESVSKLYAAVEVAKLRHSEDTEDWAAYQRELDRERRMLGTLPETADTKRMRARRRKREIISVRPRAHTRPNPR
jgi:hypothetical protein